MNFTLRQPTGAKYYITAAIPSYAPYKSATRALYSYQTLSAVLHDGIAYVLKKGEPKRTRTTARHITMFLRDSSVTTKPLEVSLETMQDIYANSLTNTIAADKTFTALIPEPPLPSDVPVAT